jgi:hypothetical protein
MDCDRPLYVTIEMSEGETDWETFISSCEAQLTELDQTIQKLWSAPLAETVKPHPPEYPRDVTPQIIQIPQIPQMEITSPRNSIKVGVQPPLPPRSTPCPRIVRPRRVDHPGQSTKKVTPIPLDETI